MEITTKKAKFTNPLYLESGRILEPYEIVYETYGELNEDKSNVVLICHALSGSHHAAGRYEGDRKPGWWDNLIGDGKAVDTTKYFVICTNVIGSCFGSTGPMSKMYPDDRPYRFKFPVVTIKDMVKAQRILLSKLGFDKIKAVIGGSMGGMQALRFAIDYPGFAEKIVSLAATHATRPWVIAFNKIAQEAILKDPNFKNGKYDPKDLQENGLSGLAIGRMAGHISFLSHYSMDRKFGRAYVANEGLYELFGRFEVERYLEYNGYNFSKWFDPLSYLYITKAINIFDLSRGYDSLNEALEIVKSKLYLIGFEKDILFLPDEMKEIKDAMDSIGKGELAEYYEVKSDYGHDAFLVEVDKFSNYINDILEGNR
ncbi:homoserine O-acetyltransferase MetX [Nitrosophilus kaiyonis]|uniref:homoserine O-acetyltransferase MetX n=1 Tax=Nitrosophilus kaiyonis TaxID=2930200 RepID=UPI00249173B8|nr:homoserine O-acetyltransferase [Nitrosophilus kaiyonis]